MLRELRGHRLQQFRGELQRPQKVGVRRVRRHGQHERHGRLAVALPVPTAAAAQPDLGSSEANKELYGPRLIDGRFQCFEALKLKFRDVLVLG